MIRLHSRPSAEALALLSALDRERRELEAQGDPLPERVERGYRHPVVKADIIAETHGKCAYCESKVMHNQFGDVEHILPKSIDSSRILDYQNLTLACQRCNNAKGNYDDPDTPLLNPYRDDLSAEIVATGPVLWHLPARPKAEMTIRRVELNRQDLIERRNERLERLSQLADRYASQPAGELKKALHELLQEETRDCEEYALAGRAFLDSLGVLNHRAGDKDKQATERS